MDKIFGFVEAKVTAPSKEELKTAILPIKINNKTVMFRDTQQGFWFSEELKMARDYGYKVEVLNCLDFDRVSGTFTNYVNDMFKEKSLADTQKNEVIRLIFKLLLNSLYGRFGMREQNIDLKLVSNEKFTKINHTENAEILFTENNLSLIKTSGYIDPDLLKLVNKEKGYVDNKTEFN